MKTSLAGEFAGKQISVTLSATNPGGFSVVPSLQDQPSPNLIVGFDDKVTFNGKDLRLEITPDSVGVKVVDNGLKKNTVTVTTPNGDKKTFDVKKNSKPTLDFGPLQGVLPGVLMDDFPFDVTAVAGAVAEVLPEEKPNTFEQNCCVIYLTSKSATEIHTLSLKRFLGGTISHPEIDGVRVDYFNQQTNFLLDTMMSAGAIDRLIAIVKKAVHDLGCRSLFIMADEAHVASGVDHQLGKVLAHFNFVSTNGGTITVDGIEVSLRIIATTATPTTKISHALGLKTPIMHVYTEPGEGYFGVDKLFAGNRFVEADKALTPAALAEILLAHPGYKKDGIIVLRLPSKARKNKDFAKELRTALGGQHAIDEFDSKRNNLKEFDEYVSEGIEARGRGAIVLLKDGFSAGFTLSSTKLIACWVDLYYNAFEAQCQSVGRIFGYGKTNDTFPVITTRHGLERYQEIIVKHRLAQIPSVNVTLSTAKRKASQSRFKFAAKAQYEIGTLKDFQEDFRRRHEVWPAALVDGETNSDSEYHVCGWTQQNISDTLHRPTHGIQLRAFDLSVPGVANDAELEKADCPKWFNKDGSPLPSALPDGRKGPKEPEAYFNSFVALRKKYKDQMAEGKTFIWASTKLNTVVSAFDANEEKTGKPLPTGIGPPDRNPSSTNDEDCVPNVFFTGDPEPWIVELVKYVRLQLNGLYATNPKPTDPIYETTIEPVAKLLSAIHTGEESTILLTAQMQAGKTGIMILLMHCLPRFINHTARIK